MAKKDKKKANRIVGSKVRESTTFTEVGFYKNVADGRVRTEVKTGGMNEVLPSTGLMDKVRVTFNVEEFKGNSFAGTVYSKDCWAEQTREGPHSNAQTVSSNDSMPNGTDWVGNSPEKAALNHQKNMIDNALASIRNLETWQKIALVLGATAFVIAVGNLIYMIV